MTTLGIYESSSQEKNARMNMDTNSSKQFHGIPKSPGYFLSDSLHLNASDR